MTQVRSGSASVWMVALLGVVAGIVLLGIVRLAAMPELAPPVHYHANWAVYVDGQRLDLSDDRYMEDVLQCAADPSRQAPPDRVHMHEGNQDIVHVHDSGATWGHLLANLEFGVGDDYLETDRGTYRNDGERTLKFIVNGNRSQSIRNRQILDTDRLLISYGPETFEEALDSQFPSVAETAAEYNTMPDPASCSGNLAEETFGDRVRRAFWF